MRYLVLSDIHGNLEALEAALQAVQADGHDQVLVLGDLVGYGADPNAVVDRIRGLQPAAIIRGNHDKVASGIEDAETFNVVARNAVQWTFEALTAENREYLAALPAGPVSVDDVVEICHGAPFDEDAYVFDELDALRALRVSSRQACLFGHTHLPAIFALAEKEERLEVTELAVHPAPANRLRSGFKYLINPGSVGQPRDGDPRAACAIVDTATRQVMLYRVPYPVEIAQEKVLKAGLPEVLAHRLALGR